ncbi:MAG: competence/damage-inducible protein A [Acidimicrobiaceae bacterium]|nr:competence/damage-inducible protein A [Acidimicrobiaceae bacterium]
MSQGARMNCEVVAVGTELLLGQIVDTNSSWIGEQLALVGIDSHHQTKVGDNLDRMISVLDQALDRSDAVIVCGGLGPTQDDITREAIAAVMGVELVRDERIIAKIETMFGGRGRNMPENNKRQADVPVGARVNPAMPGTAAGLICPLSGANEGKVIYAVPGVPWEMKEMVLEGVLPDLRERAGITAVIRSRILRTWGQSESGLAEQLDEEIRRLDETGAATIAFLASGLEGLKVRITAKARSEAEALAILDDEETRVRELIGDIVFGTDDDTIESVVLDLLRTREMTLALAESFTGGLISSRIVGHPGCSEVFRGGIIPYHRDLKQSFLGADETGDVGVVSERMVVEMAQGACRVLDADVGLALSGVAGPDPHEGVEAGVVCIGIHIRGRTGGDVGEGSAVKDFSEATTINLPFDRERIRQFSCIMALNMLRARLLDSTMDSN